MLKSVTNPPIVILKLSLKMTTNLLYLLLELRVTFRHSRSLNSSPAFSFKAKFENDLKPAVLAFRAARYFSPSKVTELKPSVFIIIELLHM